MKQVFVLALFLAASPALAQVDLGAGIGPDMFNYSSGRKYRGRISPAPLALALDRAFGTTTWARVSISTEGPVSEMTAMVRGGYYKLEIIQLILLSAEAGRPLKQTLEKRKKGSKLSELAAEYKLDYDKVYEEALAIEELVNREYLPRFPERKSRRRNDEDSWIRD